MNTRKQWRTVKNITLSADDHLIERARRLARAQNRTLNDAFREWLKQYTAQAGSGLEFNSLMERLSKARGARQFSRDEMNER
jgi:hypothetical protein